MARIQCMTHSINAAKKEALMTINIRESNLARLQEDEAAAITAGFSPKPPIYALGTPVNEIGKRNFLASRQAFERLPFAKPAMQGLIDRIKGEMRLDTQVKVRDLRMNADGTVSRGNGGMFLSDYSFQQLLSRTACKEPRAAATSRLAGNCKISWCLLPSQRHVKKGVL